MTRLHLAIALLLVPINIILGTAWHEIVGHGLVGLACGGHIEKIIVTGVQLWPGVGWVGMHGAFGWCHVDDISGPVCSHLWLLTGSLSTLAVSITAIALLGSRRWSFGGSLFLVGLSFWWIDLFTYTLPSFGLRRYILVGRRIAEPYDAALALGLPGWAFQLFVLVTCTILAVLSVQKLWTLRRNRIHFP